MQNTEELFNSLVLEMRRGAIILAVLSRLEEPHYGYFLVQLLADKDFVIEPGTLYPLLRRLEKQGLLESSWDTSESRPRKYYRLNKQGKDLYKRLLKEWKKLQTSINSLVEMGGV